MVHVAMGGVVALYAVYLMSGSKQLYDCDQHTPLTNPNTWCFNYTLQQTHTHTAHLVRSRAARYLL